jgi:hypothetical protein
VKIYIIARIKQKEMIIELKSRLRGSISVIFREEYERKKPNLLYFLKNGIKR